MKKKFKSLIYAEVYINKVSKRIDLFRATIKLGVPGNDIVITHKEKRLAALWKESIQDIHRYLNKHKNRSLRLNY